MSESRASTSFLFDSTIDPRPKIEEPVDEQSQIMPFLVIPSGQTIEFLKTRIVGSLILLVFGGFFMCYSFLPSVLVDSRRFTLTELILVTSISPIAYALAFSYKSKPRLYLASLVYFFQLIHIYKLAHFDHLVSAVIAIGFRSLVIEQKLHVYSVSSLHQRTKKRPSARLMISSILQVLPISLVSVLILYKLLKHPMSIWLLKDISVKVVVGFVFLLLSTLLGRFIVFYEIPRLCDTELLKQSLALPDSPFDQLLAIRELLVRSESAEGRETLWAITPRSQWSELTCSLMLPIENYEDQDTLNEIRLRLLANLFCHAKCEEIYGVVSKELCNFSRLLQKLSNKRVLERSVDFALNKIKSTYGPLAFENRYFH